MLARAQLEASVYDDSTQAAGSILMPLSISSEPCHLKLLAKCVCSVEKEMNMTDAQEQEGKRSKHQELMCLQKPSETIKKACLGLPLELLELAQDLQDVRLKIRPNGAKRSK